MKNQLYARSTARDLFGLALVAGLLLSQTSLAASISLATAPLSTATTSAVSPNLMFILDDSGSMGWNYMPDNANDFNGAYGFASNQCNGVYYDPTITYTAPVTSAGASYADASFTAAWNDGYNTGGGTTNLNTSFQPSSSYTAGKAFYYIYSGTQTTADKKDYYNVNSVFYNECNSSVGTTTIYDGVNPVNTLFTKRTLATTESTFITVVSGSTATITVNSASSFRAGNITVSGAGGGDIMSGRSASSSNTSTVAANIAAKINSCTVATTGNCTVAGYSATTSGNVITITGPAAGGATMSISVNSGSWTFTASAFSTPLATAVSSIKVGTTELLLSGATASSTSTTTLAASIAAGINATGYSATSSGNTVTVTGPTSAANYTPVITSVPASGGMTFNAGTFPETDPAKLTNFANWYSYYRTRMLMMKTSAGLAFKPIDNKYRVGFMTINNNVSPDIVDIGTFDATQKSAWYAKLYAATPNNSTPLRESLAQAGLLYAHKLPSNSLNGLAVRDPIQYSCQQNFTILSTDGFWNGNAGYKVDGTTAVGNQDGAAPRPMFDGARANQTTTRVTQTQTQVTRDTSQIQQRTVQDQRRTSTLQQIDSQLQQVTSHLQVQTGALQQATSSDSGSTWSAWSNVATCTWNYSSVGFASITVGGSGKTSVSSIKLNGVTELMSGATSASSTKSTVATRIAANITLAGYSATSSGAVVTVSGPASGNLVITDDGGGMTFTVNVYGGRTRCQYNTLSAAVNATGTCTSNDQSADTSNGKTWSGDKVVCTYAASAPVNVGSCTVVSPSASSPYTVLTAVACPTATTTTYPPTCTPVPLTAGGASTTCGFTAYTSWAYVAPGTCTPVPQDSATFNMSASGGIATQCQTLYNGQTTDNGAISVASCSPQTAAASNNWATVTCPPPITTGPTAVATCTPSGASSGNNWTTTSCTTNTISGPTFVGSCVNDPASASNGYVATTCNTISSTISNVASCTPQTASASNNWTTITCSAGTGGTSDTLADVAMYYYETDLRSTALSNCTGANSTDVCENNVFVSGADNNVKQHMTTFTLGLGARGRMVFTPNYLTATSGDYFSVKNGVLADSTATPPVCSWQSNGTTCNWPVPASNAIENIDDLWHAAVDGRGTYFSATDPASLSTGLSSALSSITARKGSAAAAATSTLNPVPGNNLAYLASYTTVKWIGNLEARAINTTTGEISATATWCVENTIGGVCSAPGTVITDSSGSSISYHCQTPGATIATCPAPGVFDSAASTCTVPLPLACTGVLPTQVSANSDARTIYTANSSTATSVSLVNFAYANLDPTSFNAAQIGTLSQWASLTATQKAAAEGVNLVNFLRGQNGFEDRAANLVDNRLYRYREAVLGDVLESQPFFVGAPVFSYADPGYGAFKTANSARLGTVYVGANDGMLHAFAAKDFASSTPADVGGKERWAYVPSMVIPNMWKLADKNYDIKHTNFINGSVNVADFYCTANCGGPGGAPQWRSILVGGLNAGGRGYYALDVTNPVAPTLLWEFTPAKAAPYGDANMGYSFGQAVITKMADGTWVVLVTSGYNNTSPGDGKGYLYVLNATTGALIKTIPTGAGDTITPSGLAKIASWNNVSTSNEAGFTYGGDLLGNVWRFDINAAVAPGVNPLKFATLFADAAGTIPQPVTTTPVLGKILGKRVIFVGTGKYLETSDLTNTQVQTQYAIKDDDATTTLVNPRNTLVQQTLSLVAGSTSSRSGSGNPVNFGTGRGWFVDFPDTGERVNIDSSLVSGTLLVPTIVPSNTVCSPGGYGWFNYFDYKTGGVVNLSEKINSPVVGFNYFYIGGQAILKIVTAAGDFRDPGCTQNCIPPGRSSGFSKQRSSWRELIQ